MNKHRLTWLFLLLAVVCYAMGMATAGMVLLALGAAAEVMFWVNLFRRR